MTTTNKARVVITTPAGAAEVATDGDVEVLRLSMRDLEDPSSLFRVGRSWAPLLQGLRDPHGDLPAAIVLVDDERAQRIRPATVWLADSADKAMEANCASPEVAHLACWQALALWDSDKQTLQLRDNNCSASERLWVVRVDLWRTEPQHVGTNTVAHPMDALGGEHGFTPQRAGRHVTLNLQEHGELHLQSLLLSDGVAPPEPGAHRSTYSSYRY